MSSRSARLVNAAFRKRDLDEQILDEPVPSTSGIQKNRDQAASDEDWLDFSSDDSVIDKDYKLPEKSHLNISSSDSENDFIPCSQIIRHTTIEASPEESPDPETNEDQITKKGNIWKRKTYNISLKERKRMKKK